MTEQREEGSSTIHFKSGEVIDAKTSKPIERTKEEAAADQIVYDMLFNDNPSVRGLVASINEEGEVTSSSEI